MFGLDANIIIPALISLFGLAGSVGTVLFIGGRWTERVEAKLDSQAIRLDYTNTRLEAGYTTLSKRLDDGFAALNLRIEDTNQQFDDINQRFDDVNQHTTEQLVKPPEPPLQTVPAWPERRRWNPENVSLILDELKRRTFTTKSEGIRHFICKGFMDREIADAFSVYTGKTMPPQFPNQVRRKMNIKRDCPEQAYPEPLPR